MTPWATAWQVVVGDRMVAVIADLQAAVGMANDLGGGLVPWKPPAHGQDDLQGAA